MNRTSPSIWTAALIGLAMLVTLLIVEDHFRVRRQRGSLVQFQSLVGGLGGGPATNWSRCEHSFDPRCSEDCDYCRGALAGWRRFCPNYASEASTPNMPGVRGNKRTAIGGQHKVNVHATHP